MKLKGILLVALGSAVGSCEKPTGVEEAGEGDGAGMEREVEIAPGVKMALVWCSPGSVTVGKSDAIKSGMREGAEMFRLTKGFWIGKYEVTQEQWAAVMGGDPSKFKGRTFPVENVSWNDAQAFLEKAGKGLRLPTAAEWEYACRAGSLTEFCFGDDEAELGEYAWHVGNSEEQTHPAGKKKANGWGIHEMHGNVWEWCEDLSGEDYWDDDYKGSRTDPTGSKDGSDRVFRGGSWGSIGGRCRSADRVWDYPGYRSSFLGFRVAVSSTE